MSKYVILVTVPNNKYGKIEIEYTGTEHKLHAPAYAEYNKALADPLVISARIEVIEND